MATFLPTGNRKCLSSGPNYLHELENICSRKLVMFTEELLDPLYMHSPNAGELPMHSPLYQLTIFQHFIDQERLTQKLAESYPFRRAAQLTAYFMQRGHEKVEELKESETIDRLRETTRDKIDQADRKKDESVMKANNFFSTFFSELGKEWKKEKKNIDEKNKESKDEQKKLD